MQRFIVYNNPIHIHSIINIFGISLYKIEICLLIMNTYEFDWVYKYGDGYESLFSKMF